MKATVSQMLCADCDGEIDFTTNFMTETTIYTEPEGKTTVDVRYYCETCAKEELK